MDIFSSFFFGGGGLLLLLRNKRCGLCYLVRQPIILIIWAWRPSKSGAPLFLSLYPVYVRHFYLVLTLNNQLGFYLLLSNDNKNGLLLLLWIGNKKEKGRKREKEGKRYIFQQHMTLDDTFHFCDFLLAIILVWVVSKSTLE